MLTSLSSSPSSDETVWPSATTSGKLSRTNASAYLERIKLPLDLLDSPPSLDLLRRLEPAHMLAVPFESLTVHVPSWHDLDAEINLGGGETTHLGEKGFRRIVELKRGSYCFGINSTFATLLRFFGFRVSECAARVFTKQMQDPEVVGYEWESTSHQVSIVDWEGSDGRYLVDVGFGRSCAYPIPLIDGVEASSLLPAEVYQLRQTPSIPGISSNLLPDSAPYWSVWRRIVPASGNAFYSPVYTFLLQSVPFRDFVTYNHYQSTHPSARFRTFLVATLPNIDGERVTLQYTEGQVDPEGKKAAKLTRTARLTDEGKQGEELELRWIEMRVGAVREVLEREFDMLFPQDYSGN